MFSVPKLGSRVLGEEQIYTIAHSTVTDAHMQFVHRFLGDACEFSRFLLRWWDCPEAQVAQQLPWILVEQLDRELTAAWHGPRSARQHFTRNTIDSLSVWLWRPLAI